jgi:hypothetical protein
VLLLRVVAELDIDSGGYLRPRHGVAWHVEKARGESRLHRQLAALVDAPAPRIVAFASTYGLLHRHVPSQVDLPEPVSRALTTAIGQEATDNSVRLRDWLQAGAAGEPPPGTTDTLVASALYASLSDSYLDAFDLLVAGTDPGAGSFPAEAFLAGFLPVAAATAPAASLLLQDPGLIAAMDRARLLCGLRVYKWGVRMLAGLDDAPAAIAALGGPDALLRSVVDTVPDAAYVPKLLDGPDGPATKFVRSLTQETVKDWYDAGRFFHDQVQTVRLVHPALGRQGVTPGEKAAQLEIYANVAGFRPQIQLSAADIADRARPHLAARIETELASARWWPPRRDGVAGLYVRALLALWTDLNQTTPPVGCATPGCLAAVPPTRNRRYCDSCQAERRRESVRRTRARPPGAG